MASATTKIVFIAISGADCVGVISGLAGHLFDMGANLREVAFGVLGSRYEFTCVAQFDESIEPSLLKRGFEKLEVLQDANIAVTPFDIAGQTRDGEKASHHITLTGGDRPGLIARITEVFVSYGANVVRMNSGPTPLREGGSGYATWFAVAIPAERVEGCLAAVTNTAGQLSLHYEIKSV